MSGAWTSARTSPPRGTPARATPPERLRPGSIPGVTGVFVDYAADRAVPGGLGGDEAVDPAGRLRPPWAPLGEALDRLGTAGLAAAARVAAAEREHRGVVVVSWEDGRRRERPLPLDPVPRVLAAAEWDALAAGVVQRHRALNSFLADAYRAAGRRRGDADRDPEVVRAGVLPAWVAAHSPSREPEAVSLAWPGQPRATVAATDLLRTTRGDWLVLGEDLRAPAGLGLALAGRDSSRAAVPSLLEAVGDRLADPSAAVPLLVAALRSAAPPGCAGEPSCAVLVPGDGADFDVRLLAGALGIPVVRPGDLWPRADGGLEALVDGVRQRVDVLHRRVAEGELAVHRAATGQPVQALLAEGVRSGRLGLATVPGNGLADDRALHPWVPAMIRFYLGEEPLLAPVPTWVLADDAQWAQARTRLHELVLKPVGGYGGGGVVFGPACSAAELARLQAEVTAAPHRFVAQELVDVSTVPTVVGERLAPRHVDLRVFSVAGPTPRALPAPLTRVSGAAGTTATGVRDGGLVKDTCLVR
ncbi:MAG: circularly permuted type 2 ATP-grasp protein [Actinobacteria bacterium]|nr:circularly permuted type 2 ATP-grasp protein [Actinomycetota bacterium]